MLLAEYFGIANAIYNLYFGIANVITSVPKQ